MSALDEPRTVIRNPLYSITNGLCQACSYVQERSGRWFPYDVTAGAPRPRDKEIKKQMKEIRAPAIRTRDRDYYTNPA